MVSQHILRWYGKTWALAATVSTFLALIGICTASVKLIRGAERAISYFQCTLSKIFDKTIECLEAPDGMYFGSWLALFATSLLVCSARVTQLFLYPHKGRSFLSREYYRLLCACCFLVLLDVLRIIYWTDTEFNMFERIIVIHFHHPVTALTRALQIYGSLIPNFFMCALELCFRDQFRQYMRNIMVTQAAEYFVTADSVSRIFTNTRTRFFPRLKRILSWFRCPQVAYISLPDDQGLEMGVSLTPSAGPPSPSFNLPELKENIIHWSRTSSDSHTSKSLWITSNNNCAELACTVSEFLSFTASDSPPGTSLVDVSRTHTVFWPLIRGLVAASPEYRCEIGRHPPVPFEDYFRSFPIRPTTFGDGGGWEVWPWLGHGNYKTFINQLLRVPLETVYKRLTRQNLNSRRTDEENILPSELPHITLIVHGVRNMEQANQLYETIDRLSDFCQWIGIVVITEPQLLLHLSDSARVIMENVCTMCLPDIGPIIYSGKYPSPPMFYESLFLPLLGGIHCGGDNEPLRRQSTLADAALLFDELTDTCDDDTTNLTASIFSLLFKASVVRNRIIELLFKFQVMKRAHIDMRLTKDNTKIADMLQRLFECDSYKKDIPFLPQEHVLAVMNLTSHITRHGVSNNTSSNVFDVQPSIWHFLSWLSAYMDRLPDDTVVNGVVLLSDHPVKHGGFSDVYHARYEDSDGKQEVALKVLKIFEDQTDQNHRGLHQKFMAEALVWHSLRHPNIVPMLGIDSITFPPPSRALVLPWMPLGNVLTYMREHSPSSPYAGDLLHDVVLGLRYLHYLNVVHGDLCGRNILIDKNGRACLSDFGLAEFIHLNHSIKSPARGGSTRWMAPELIAPPPDLPFRRTRESDVWALGCVCCEIWSEGKIPFSHILTNMGVVLAISGSAEVRSQESPYPARPHNKCGNPMPDDLWNMVQWCLQYEPSKRPDAHMMAGMIGGVEQYRGQHVSVASGSASPFHATQPAPTLSVEDLNEQVSMPSSSRATARQMTTSAIRFDEGYGTVLFGPVEAGNPEALFSSLFKSLSQVAPKGGLVEPLLVQPDNDHLLLCFRSLLEANTFAMTWMIHRFDPYLQVTATVVDDE
ncbi:Kinase-like protein [Mycena sanguinolenta]|uniref:Kinase-like protein n=1 Tax=Mycena sanguinolenta TaxID=230812 RepID=A0A8H6ZCB9_9AGAR|nr:Kinase-like protein [Mycena sanguinolenta]